MAELALRLGSQSYTSRHVSCNNCLGLAILGVFGFEVLLIVLPWPLLHMASVKPAWPPALLGLLSQLMLVVLYGSLGVPLRQEVLFVLAPAAVYATAAFATTSGAAPRWRLVAVAAVLVGYPLVTGWLIGFAFMPSAILARLHL